ncbi:glycosyltransferase, partial [Candidatus Desantisbacteria bacterium]|nr:glycosyltransferase [Candidatus Desantisbacteria bacterium]
MNIAVISEQPMNKGGGFQQELTTILLLYKYKSSVYNFIFFSTVEDNIYLLKKHNLDMNYIKITLWDKLLRSIKRCEIIYAILNSPSPFAFDLTTHNYILTVWDLCHRDFVEFPEMRESKSFERKEKYFLTALKKAAAIIADSNYGKANIIRRYGIDDDRVFALPFQPANFTAISDIEYEKDYIDIKIKYKINGNYIFYPAQFWTHKNHIYILEALKILKDNYKIELHAVFCGSDIGNLKYVLSKAKSLDIDSIIHYIGFADNKEMPYLYKQSAALVMPTYFGPTNIPPLEAFQLGCPVCYSNLPGLKEQVQESAFLIDLDNPQSLVEALLTIMKDKDEVNRKIISGKEKVASTKEED